MKKLLLLATLFTATLGQAQTKTFKSGYIDLAWGDECSAPWGNKVVDLTQIQSPEVFIKLYKGNGGYRTRVYMEKTKSMVTTKSRVSDCHRLARCARALSSEEISVSAQCVNQEENLIVNFIPNLEFDK